MDRLLFIYNPASGTGQVKNALAEVLDVFTKAGWITTSYPTQCKGDAARTARELAGQFDRVICAGGDGTLSEVVSGLMELEAPPPLGYPVCPNPSISAGSTAGPLSMWPPSAPLPRWLTTLPRS